MVITREAVVDAEADDVWRVVAHEFARIGVWATAVPSSLEVAGGRVCRTTMGAFPEVEERIVAVDEAERTFAYEPVRGLPTFVAGARSTWRVVAIDERRSRVGFTATVTTRGVAGLFLAPAMRIQLRRAGARGLDDLRHYVEHGRPSPRKQRQLVGASDANL